MMARVRGVIAASSLLTSILKSSGETSTNTGLAPTKRMASAELIQVKGTVTTSSPGPMPSARSAISRLSVPLATVIACRTPV